MRIAINTRFLLPKYLEGLGFFTQEICRELVRRRPRDQFLFLFDRPYDSRFIFGTNVEAMSVWPPARDPLLWTAWFEWRLPSKLRRWRADVFLSPDGYCSLRSTVPTVMVTHDIAHVHYPEQIPRRARHYYQKNVPRFLRRAERIVTVSEFVRRDIQSHYGIDGTKITVACNGVKSGFRPATPAEKRATRREFSGGQPYFFYLGAVHPRKNIDRLIEAYGRYRAGGGPPHKLLLGGRMAWQTQRTKSLHAASPYRADIQFLGYVPTPKIPTLLGSAHALVYPSLSEGFGVPLLEAMHCEVPIITSNVTSLPEVVGEAALLVDPLDTDDLARALQQISSNEPLSARLVATGRRQRERFTWGKATDVIEAAIVELGGG